MKKTGIKEELSKCGHWYIMGIAVLSFFALIASTALANEWCYQEHANASTACGGMSTGTYYNASMCTGGYPCTNFWDGDWSSATYSNNFPPQFYINYTTPPYASNETLWQISDCGGALGCAGGPFIRNVTLGGCWNATKIKLNVTASSDGNAYWYCWNETGTPAWSLLYHSTGAVSSWIQEEAMWWKLQYPGIYNESSNTTNITTGGRARFNATITGGNTSGVNFTVMSPNGTTSTGTGGNYTESHWAINCSEQSTVCNTSQVGTFELVSITAESTDGNVTTKSTSGVSFLADECMALTFANSTAGGGTTTNASMILSNGSYFNYTNVNHIDICSSITGNESTSIIFNNQTQRYDFEPEDMENETIYMFEATTSIVVSVKNIRDGAPIKNARVQVQRSNGTAMLLTGQYLTDTDGEFMLNCTPTDEIILIAVKEGYNTLTEVILTKDWLNGKTLKMTPGKEWYTLEPVYVNSGGILITTLPAYRNLTVRTRYEHSFCFIRYENGAVLGSTTCETGRSILYELTIPIGTTSESIVIQEDGTTYGNVTYKINLTISSGENITGDDFTSGMTREEMEMGFGIAMLIFMAGLSYITQKTKESIIATAILFSFVSTIAQILLILAGILWIWGQTREHIN